MFIRWPRAPVSLWIVWILSVGAALGFSLMAWPWLFRHVLTRRSEFEIGAALMVAALAQPPLYDWAASPRPRRRHIGLGAIIVAEAGALASLWWACRTPAGYAIARHVAFWTGWILGLLAAGLLLVVPWGIWRPPTRASSPSPTARPALPPLAPPTWTDRVVAVLGTDPAAAPERALWLALAHAGFLAPEIGWDAAAFRRFCATDAVPLAVRAVPADAAMPALIEDPVTGQRFAIDV